MSNNNTREGTLTSIKTTEHHQHDEEWQKINPRV
jgi:hypothetical protein